MPETPVTFHDVEVVSDTDLMFRCRVQGKVVLLGEAQVLAGTTVRRAGQRGLLVLPRWALKDLGLTEPGDS